MLFVLIEESVYSSRLTDQNQVYMRECGRGNYFYETMELNFTNDGYYSFGCISQTKTFAYLYKTQFNSLDPDKNLIVKNGNDLLAYRFAFSVHLDTNQTYILLVTTVNPNEKDSFSIVASGPTLIGFNKKSRLFFFFFFL